MAPRKKKVVKTTTKVVQETVEVVSVIGSQEDQALARPEVTEEQTSVTKSIPIEDQETETQDLEIEKLPTPPREEAPPRKEEYEGQARTKVDGPSAQNEAQEVKKEKAAKTSTTGRKRGKKRMRGEMGEGYKRYVFRVMKQVHPGMGITSGAMTVINNFMTDMFERLAGEASKLSTYSKKQTMTAREIQGAVKLVLPGELGKHAVAEGSKAVTNYVTYDSKK
ncbi:hypothetical protein SOVF_008320 [Spinacia oleracea]|uniref:Core Histone H2A/H2B/H3 domain-containing protein n=1 Tax=Spinacia oleracea TaxID=3562 RepID=A0A9R0JRB6_SPIOL|nr:uncharacterized protein LOC110783685 [Spinacia oleracea]KNA25241.1 hypothetical protein SOVF_008320 [Spinacia oleracea]